MTYAKIENALRDDKELLELFLDLTQNDKIVKLDNLIVLSGIFTKCDGKFFYLSKRLYENHELVKSFVHKHVNNQQVYVISLRDKIEQHTRNAVSCQASEDIQIAAGETRVIADTIRANLIK